jgi:cytochrome oxidase Cu insertion factor (SCO1/SenC/PrrC family)
MRERRGSRAVVAVTMVLALAGALGAPALRASGTTTDPPASLLVQPFVEPVPLPAVALTDLEGRALGAAQLRGKTVLLNFWAT